METIAILCGISFKLKYTSSISDNLAHQIYPQLFITYSDMEVSCNGDTPKSSIKKNINHPFWGSPFVEPPICCDLLPFGPFWCFIGKPGLREDQQVLSRDLALKTQSF